MPMNNNNSNFKEPQRRHQRQRRSRKSPAQSPVQAQPASDAQSQTVTADGSALFDSARNTLISGGQFTAAASVNRNVTININATDDVTPQIQTESYTSRQTTNRTRNRKRGPARVRKECTGPLQRSNEIYEQHLRQKKRGHPLWIPQPNMVLPIPYRAQGARIGDVGIFTDDGGFDFLFNICVPRDDPINPGELPENFVPIYPSLNPIDIRKFAEFSPGSYLASSSVSESKTSEQKSGLVFESSACEGAILTMPEGSYSENLSNYSRFGKYINTHAEDWYKFVNGPRGREAQNGDLRVVVGCDKTTAWGMATFVNSSSSHDTNFRLKFCTLLEQPSHCNAGNNYSWEHSGVAEVRVGPGRGENEELGETKSNRLRNQCLFLRTLGVSLSEEVWREIFPQTIAVADQNDSQSGVPDHSMPCSHGSSTGHSLSQSTQSGPSPDPSFPSHNSMDILSGTSEIAVEEVILTRSSSCSSVMHPSKIINQYLLEQVPHARVAVTHDRDWSDIIGMDSCQSDSSQLLSVLLSMNDIVVDDETGLVSLELKENDENGKLSEEAKVAGLIESIKDGRVTLDQYLFGFQGDHCRRLQDLCNILRSGSTNQTIPMSSFLTGHPERPLSLDELMFGSTQHQSIVSLRAELNSLPSQHGDQSNRSSSLLRLADSLSRRFSRWAQRDDLEEAICCYEEALPLTQISHYQYLEILLGLCSSLYRRFYLLGHADDLQNLLGYLELQYNIVNQRCTVLAPVEAQLKNLYGYSGSIEEGSNYAQSEDVIMKVETDFHGTTEAPTIAGLTDLDLKPIDLKSHYVHTVTGYNLETDQRWTSKPCPPRQLEYPQYTKFIPTKENDVGSMKRSRETISSMEQPVRSSPRIRAKYNFACDACARRKIRCDGLQPVCLPCQSRGKRNECTWTRHSARIPRTRTEAYTKAMHRQTEDLRKRATDFRNYADYLESLLDECHQHHQHHRNIDFRSSRPSDSDGLLDHDALDRDDEHHGSGDGNDSNEMAICTPPQSSQAEEEGHTLHHGNTAPFLFLEPFDQPSQFVALPEKPEATYVLLVDGVDPSHYNPTFDWSRHLPSAVPLDRSSHDKALDLLFKFFTSWCLRIVPSLFLRDMYRALSTPPFQAPPKTPHYSPMLHNALVALALAFSDEPKFRDPKSREYFANTAKGFIEVECLKPELSVAHALSILASFHSSQGDQTLGYMYFDMSARMSQACLNSDRPERTKLEITDEVDGLHRNWAGWTTFTQDVCWSLYVGRDFCVAAPAEGKAIFKSHIIDPEFDEKPWFHLPAGIGPQSNNLTKTFEATCRLLMIARRIMDVVNGNKAQHACSSEFFASIRDIDVQLNIWKDTLTAELEITAESLSNATPHKLMLHLAYWWLHILLHRPFLRQKSRSIHNTNHEIDHVKLCRRATENIMELLLTWRKLYTLRYCPITLIQTVFSAGTVYLLTAMQASSGTRIAQKELQHSLDQETIVLQYLGEIGSSWKCATNISGILERFMHTQIRPLLERQTRPMGASGSDVPDDEEDVGSTMRVASYFTTFSS